MKIFFLQNLLFIIFIFSSYAGGIIDSLENELSKTNHESSRVNLLVELCWQYQAVSDYRKAKEYCDEAVLISKEKRNFQSLLGKAYSNLGVIENNQGNYESAIEFLLKSIQIREAGEDKKALAASYNNLGISYDYLGNYPKALEYYSKSLKIKEDINDKQGIAASLSNIGVIYYYWADSFQMANDTVAAKEKYTSALDYYNRSLNLRKELGLKKDIGYSLTNIGNIHSNLGNIPLALDYHFQSLKIAEELNDKSSVTAILSNIGNHYLRIHQYEKAVFYLEKSLTLSLEIASKDDEMIAYKSLADVYENKKDFKNSLKYFQKYFSLRQEIYNEESSKNIAEMQTKYETEKKEKQIAVLNQAQQEKDLKIAKTRNALIFSIAIIAIVLLLLVIGFLFFKQYKLKTTSKNMEMEQKLLRSQMNPHFIFNSLNSIQSFIYQNKNEDAEKYLTQFAELMRLILQNSRYEYISLEKEIKTLENYLALQQVRFENKFDFTIKIGKEINTEEVAIPPMLAQPFIENSIEHGIKTIERKGLITIDFKLKDRFLFFTVTDNGIGLKHSQAIKNNNPQHESFATKITEERINNLNRQYGYKIKLVYEDLLNEKNEVAGTKVEFAMPFKTV